MQHSTTDDEYEEEEGLRITSWSRIRPQRKDEEDRLVVFGRGVKGEILFASGWRPNYGRLMNFSLVTDGSNGFELRSSAKPYFACSELPGDHFATAVTNPFGVCRIHGRCT